MSQQLLATVEHHLNLRQSIGESRWTTSLVPKVISESAYREAAQDMLPAHVPVYLVTLGFLEEDSATVIERLKKLDFGLSRTVIWLRRH